MNEEFHQTGFQERLTVFEILYSMPLVLAVVSSRIDTEFETGIGITIIRAKALQLSTQTQYQYLVSNWVPQFAPPVPKTVFQEYS